MNILTNITKTLALYGIVLCMCLAPFETAQAAPNTGPRRVELCERLRDNLMDACLDNEFTDCEGLNDAGFCRFDTARRAIQLQQDILYYELRCGHIEPWPSLFVDCDPQTIPAPEPATTVGEYTGGVLYEEPRSTPPTGTTSTTGTTGIYGQVFYETDDGTSLTLPVGEYVAFPEPANFDLVSVGTVRFGGTEDLKTLVVPVRNEGNRTGQGGRGITSLMVNGELYTGSLYVYLENGFISTGPFAPGEYGFIQVWDANGFDDIVHCDSLDVEIDYLRDVQFGPGVFDNDRAELDAREMGNARECSWAAATLDTTGFEVLMVQRQSRPPSSERPTAAVGSMLPVDEVVSSALRVICELSDGSMDSDCDEIPDSIDLCPIVVQGDLAQTDSNGDGTPDECQCGDPNGTGQFESADLAAVYRCLQNDPNGTNECADLLVTGDANGSGAFESADLLLIFNAMKGQIPVAGLHCAANPPADIAEMLVP